MKGGSIMTETKRTIRWAPFFAAIVVLAALTIGSTAHAEIPRRVNAALESRYYIFDSEFFGLDGALGIDAALRCELGSDIYVETGLGLFKAQGDDAGVDGLDYHLNLLALFPVLLPYRPVARLGVGFLSVNPVTVTPTDTFRPTQTTFYLLGGAGVTRSISSAVLLEASANFWITPYEYRIYRFNRLDVETSAERFTHLSISLALTYTF